MFQYTYCIWGLQFDKDRCKKDSIYEQTLKYVYYCRMTYHIFIKSQPEELCIFVILSCIFYYYIVVDWVIWQLQATVGPGRQLLPKAKVRGKSLWAGMTDQMLPWPQSRTLLLYRYLFSDFLNSRIWRYIFRQPTEKMKI